MKIVTYNLNGIRAALNRNWLHWIRQNEFDIICIQELKAEPAQLDLSIFEQAGYNCYWHAAQKKGYSGVAIFSKMKPDHVEYGCGAEDYDREGRVIRADYGDTSVFSIYFPSGTMGEIRQSVKYQFLNYIYDYFQQLLKARQKIIVCGDYNIANKDIDIHNPISNKNSTGFLPDERAWLDKFFVSGFIDTFRYLIKEPHNYTWWSFRTNARTNNKGWRIDYIAITENLLLKLSSVKIMSDAIHSDHCPVMVEIDL